MNMQVRYLVIMSAAMYFVSAGTYYAKENEFADTWRRIGQERLKKALKRRPMHPKEVAKNVILFIGDGMGMSTITATRIYKGQLLGKTGEEHDLNMDTFPSVGLAKTYEVDTQVPDSAGTATAILSGVKTNLDVVGLDARVMKGECDPGKYAAGRLDNIVYWSHDAGKHTGVITTTRITHATPATAYAHVGDRYWECDAMVPEEFKNCTKDVARQMVEDEPGRSIKVLMGGGLTALGSPVTTGDTGKAPHCQRQDGRNLLETWKQGPGRRLFVNNTQQLMNADLSKVDYLLALFSPDHMPYSLKRAEGPTLSQMTRQAIKMLSRNPKGYFLLVEGGNVDNAHHDNFAQHALADTAEMDDAVGVAMEMTDPRDTLIVVTSDHSHTLTISGYPDRGSDVLGRAMFERYLIGPHKATLSYSNGPGFYVYLNNRASGLEWPWRELHDEELRDPNIPSFAGWVTLDGKETHSGEDVPAYALGPNSDLVTGVFEQNYLAHFIGYSACIGPGVTACSSAGVTEVSVLLLAVVVFRCFFLQ